MPSFPLSSPESYGIAVVDWEAASNDSYAFNPWTFDLVKQIFDGRMWRGSLTVTAQNEANGRSLSAWLTALRRGGANAGTFYLGDPAAAEPLGSAKDTPGSPVVSGASQTGEALNVSGLPLSATGYLLAGDYIQIGTGTSSRLKKVLDDVDSDGSGNATINCWPPIRTAPADTSAITVSSPQGLFIATGISAWNVVPPAVYRATIDVAEVVP